VKTTTKTEIIHNLVAAIGASSYIMITDIVRQYYILPLGTDSQWIKTTEKS